LSEDGVIDVLACDR